MVCHVKKKGAQGATYEKSIEIELHAMVEYCDIVFAILCREDLQRTARCGSIAIKTHAWDVTSK